MDTFQHHLRIPVLTVQGEEYISFFHRRSYEVVTPNHDPFCSGCYELFMHVTGTCNFIVDDRKFSPQYGDLFLFPANQMHRLVTQGDLFERFLVVFSPHVFDSVVCEPPILNLFNSSEAGGNQIILPSGTSKEILSMLYRLSEAVQKGRPETPYLIYSDALRILVLVKKMLEQSFSIPLGTNCPRILGEIVDYIQANYQTIQSSRDVYEHFGISRAYLTKIFARYTVVTPYNYIRNLKLSHAKRMLAQGASVTEACFDSGFTDYSNFIRTFHKKAGETPFVYKSRQHKED